MATPLQQFDSAYTRRRNLFELITLGATDERVIQELIYDGTGVSDEAVLWDFKAEVPVSRPGIKLSDSASRKHEYKLHEIVKDVVAFYNSYGGYLIVGVDDRKREAKGFDGVFDTSDLNRKVYAATGHAVECIFRSVRIPVKGELLSLGLIFIPRRPGNITPAQFRKDSPRSETGTYAYKANTFYLRQNDNCKPAETPEEYEFLFSSERRSLFEFPLNSSSSLENNLPKRDQDLNVFIGRSEELSQLWSWIADAFSPVKILSGLGGVGKTSIAFTFCERFIYESPADFQKVVWLGAKQRTFSALAGRIIETNRVDYTNVDAFLIELLLELGCPSDQIPEEPAREDLLQLCIDHLQAYRYLVVIDDVDTLEDEQQQEIYNLSLTLLSRTSSKALITARRSLGAPRTQFIEVRGFEYGDFVNFVEATAKLLKIEYPFPGGTRSLQDLHEVTDGSPLFTMSVLRLVSLGDRLDRALRNWRGSDGEKAREAAFSREVSRLDLKASRVLLCAVYLKEASLVEISSILKLSRYEVQECIATLKDFSMMTLGSELPGGQSLVVPRSILLMTSVIEKKVQNHEAIKKECANLRLTSQNREKFVADAINRALAFLKSGTPKEAVETIETALGYMPDSGDLYCMLGRCQVALDHKLAGEAEEAFAKAKSLGCSRRELYDYWLEARLARKDWRGVIELAKQGDEILGDARYAVRRAVAYRELGDELIRATRYDDAATTYMKGIEDAKDSHNATRTRSYRADLRKIQKELILRWLGVLNTNSTNSGKIRFFGACCRCIFRYNYFDDGLLLSATRSADEWLKSIERRGTVSDTSSKIISITLERLEALRRFAHSNANITLYAAELIETFSASFRERVEILFSQEDPV